MARLINKDIIIKRQQAEIERLRQAVRYYYDKACGIEINVPEWVDGTPPNFNGQDVWIIAEIPSRWLDGAVGYKCFKWIDPNGWTDKEVLSARRWMMLLLPESNANVERACRVCGCTQNNACPGGCYWVEDELCSKCGRSKE